MKKESTNLYLKTLGLMFVLICAFTFSSIAQCRLLNETFNVNPVLSATNVDGNWYPDRYRPAAFISDVLAGSNVLKISIDGVNDGLSNRPIAYQSGFYNTQGRKFNQCNKCVTVLKGSLWIPSDWATDHRRSDMWATAFNIADAVSFYPIIGFRNPDAVSPGIYYWTGTGGWVNSGVTIIYDSWYNFEFRIVGSNVEYLVNNVVVATVSSNSSVYFGDIIMQAYNFNDPTLPVSSQSTDSYDAYWDNLITTGTGGNVVTNLNTGETFCTIQTAINASTTSSGHIISVGPGTYSEAVIINKSIQLKGQAGQVLNTIIKAPATLPNPSTQNSNIVAVTGAGISAEISDLTIAGPGPSGCGSISYGIFVRSGADANIHDNRIINIRDNPFSGCQNGVAIQVGRNAWSTTGTATITNNIISGYQKNGITVDNLGSSATISGNTITGAGTTNIIAQNGIQISRGATGILNGNTVTGNSYFAGTIWDWGSTGILLYQNGAVSLTGSNNLSGNDQNFYAYDPTGIITLGAEIFGSSSAPLGFGNQIANVSTQNLDVTSCTFNGTTPAAMTMTQLFNLEDYIYHSIDNPEMGFVYVKTNNSYVTKNSFDAGSGYPDAQIQRGIDASSNGFTVNVQAGVYAKQIATNRNVFGVNGPHQFGLFVDKDNLTIRGYDGSDAPVANAAASAVEFTTGATNNFGSSGIFVQANGVTLEGLKVGNNLDNANANSNNKTIEIIGDAFAMNKCWINTATDEGAVYMGRWDAAHPVSSYNISNNKFENTLVSINNGVGLTGLVSGRKITNNEFVGVATPYLIGFRGWNGASPIQGWIVDPVGGAVVTGNVFNTTGVDKYIVARGNAGGYLNNELNWADMWNLNTYGNHVVTLSNVPSFSVRPYTDAAGYPETRRISPKIQENETIGQTGDVVLVSAGTYNENVIVNKPVILKGANYNVSCSGVRGAESIISGILTSGSKSISVDADNVTINGFTIKNPLGSFGIYAKGRNNTDIQYNIVTDIGNNVTGSLATYGVSIEMGSAAHIANVKILNNCVNNIRGGENTSLTGAAGKLNNGSGVAIGAGFSTAAFDVSGLEINNNIIDDITACIDAWADGGKGAYGVLINVGANPNVLYPGKAVSPKVQNNKITDLEGLWSHGVGLEGETPGAKVENNYMNNFKDYKGNTDAVGVFVEQNDGVATIEINENSFTNMAFAIKNLMGITLFDATCNWYGTYTGPGSKISGNTNYSPWLTSGVDNNLTMLGFQPLPTSCQGTANMFTTFKCGKKNEKKVILCHNGTTICISTSDLQIHLNHGDVFGACPNAPAIVEYAGEANVKENKGSLPAEFKISNYPNPFTNVTRFVIDLPEDSRLLLKVYDITGREVSTLINDNRKAGIHYVEFNAARLGAGSYFGIMKASSKGKEVLRTVKMIKQ